VIVFYSTGYGYKLEGQEYTDGWVFQARLPLGQPVAPDHLPEEVLTLFHGMAKSVFSAYHAQDDTLYLAFWSPRRIFEKYLEGRLPEPMRPTGPITIVDPEA